MPVAALLLAAWLGASLYFTVVVTRAAFAVLPTRTLAGALVGQTLPVLFDTGMLVGAGSSAAALLSPAGAARTASLAGGIVIAVLAAAARFVILARIERLSLAMPARDRFAPRAAIRCAARSASCTRCRWARSVSQCSPGSSSRWCSLTLFPRSPMTESFAARAASAGRGCASRCAAPLRRVHARARKRPESLSRGIASAADRAHALRASARGDGTRERCPCC